MGGSKMQNGRFPCKIALCFKKVCYKVSLRENLRQQSKVFTGLSIRAKVIGGDDPLDANFALSKPFLGMAACSLALPQNLTNTLPASQLL